MKKTFTLVLSAFIFSVGVIAQSNTMYMIEEGTQASCGPCATQNPGFDALMSANNDKVVVIKYQTWWPGYDPMYLDNTEEVVDRIDYYGINGVPTAVGNGSEWANDCGAWAGAPACLNQAEIDAVYNTTSPLSMTISGVVVNGVLEVTGTVTADEALSGDLRLRIALTEQTILKTDAPGGSNSETAYHHVMKKFLGGPQGISLGDMAMGDVYTINESLPLGILNIYNNNELEVVAFVQNNSTKQVYQAAKDQEIELTSNVANNAIAGTVEGLPLLLCAGLQSVTPQLKLVNGGSEVLTSTDITYTASGGASMIYNWTGSIDPLESETVTLDPINVQSNLWNEAFLEFTVSNPNGVPDESEPYNTTVVNIDPAPDAGASVEVSITTDAYGDEVYWEMRNGAGDIIISGGNPNVGLDNIGTGNFPPPSDPNMYGNNTTYTEVVDVSNVDCYTFHITDYYGDGLLGAAGYTIRDDQGQVMYTDSENYSIEAMKDFSSGAVSVSENILEGAVLVGPNPVSDLLNVSISLDTTEDVLVEMVNSLGQVVLSEIMNSSSTKFDVSSFDSGIYYLNFTSGEARTSKKINVIK